MSIQTKVEFLQHILTITMKVLETILRVIDVISDKVKELN